MDGYLYVATPYTKYPGGIEEAFREACRVTAVLMRQGAKVFSPIAHTHPIATYGGIDPKDWEFWMAADAPLMEAASGLIVVMMPGWEESAGVAAEIEAFKAAGKPIYYRTMESLR